MVEPALIASQIRNELECVSISGLAQAHGVSRKVAAQVLSQVILEEQQPEEGEEDHIYQAMYITQSNTTRSTSEDEDPSSDSSVPCTGKSFVAEKAQLSWLSVLKHNN